MIYTNDIIKRKKSNYKKIKKAFRFIYMPFFIAIVLVVAYMGYFKFIKKENNVSIFGFKQYMVLTGSMEPTYNIGDLIIVKEVKEDELEVGDVITYSVGKDTETISHRIVDIIEQNDKKQYKTKGDNNNSLDPELITYNQIQGKIVYKIPSLGLILTKVTTGTGIAIIFLFIALSYIRSSRREEKRIAREDARRRFNKPKYTKEGTL